MDEPVVSSSNQSYVKSNSATIPCIVFVVAGTQLISVWVATQIKITKGVACMQHRNYVVLSGKVMHGMIRAAPGEEVVSDYLQKPREYFRNRFNCVNRLLLNV